MENELIRRAAKEAEERIAKERDAIRRCLLL